MFRLLRYFSLTSLVLVLLAALALGALYRHIATENLLQLGERNNVALSVALANALRTEFTAVVEVDAGADRDAQRQRIAQLNTLVLRQTRGLSVAKVKIYNTRGKTVYSSEDKQIGEDKSANRGFVQALGGQPASELTHRDTFSAFEQQIMNRDLLSSYVPVRSEDGRRVQAVFEIYDDITPLLAQVATTQQRIMGGVALVLAMLYAVLFLLVRHADRILQRQHTEQSRHENELAAARDQLEQRVAERTAELERANRAKSQFLANMSHEIRTPMNAVLGLSELLAASGLSGTQLRHAENIHSSATSLLGVINDVLDVSRIEAGHLELVTQRFEPLPLLAQVRAMLLPLAENKGLAFETRINAGVPQVLQGDAGRLRQILVNLIGNAIKFTQRGRVDVEVHVGNGDGNSGGNSSVAPATRPAGAPRTVVLQIQVKDTGVGISPEQLMTLFKPFVQVDASDTRRHGGSGLGLFIVRELAQRMGGQITAQSLPGVGSIFELTLTFEVAAPETAAAPLAADRNSTASPAGTARAAATGATGTPARSLAVLLVEDNEINRMVARAMLEAAGHRVSEAHDGAHAVTLHAAQGFDCILMDAQMPEMDGIEATRRIREREAGEGNWRTPIVALTANAMRGDRERYLAAGMDGFLAKPYDSASLLAAIDSAAGPAPNRARSGAATPSSSRQPTAARSDGFRA